MEVDANANKTNGAVVAEVDRKLPWEFARLENEEDEVEKGRTNAGALTLMPRTREPARPRNVMLGKRIQLREWVDRKMAYAKVVSRIFMNFHNFHDAFVSDSPAFLSMFLNFLHG